MRRGLLILGILLCSGCVSLEDRAQERANNIIRWQYMYHKGMITMEDYESLVRTQGELK